MLSVINVVLPIFSIIFLGWLCGRTKRLGATAASELNRYVVWLALPALLFKITANASPSELWQPGFLAVYVLGCVVIYAVTLLWRLSVRAPLADATLDALGASYSNTGYVGLPLCVLVLGEAGLQPSLLATLVVVCVLFGFALACVEASLNQKDGIGSTIRAVSMALLKNPLVLSPLIGVLWSISGMPLPAALITGLDMLSTSAAPVALVSLGLFLALPQTAGKVDGVWSLVFLKLIAQPLLTAVLAFWVFDLPREWALAALLLSALPTGTGPFMLAEYYRREGARVARLVLLSTVCSVITLSACLMLLGV